MLVHFIINRTSICYNLTMSEEAGTRKIRIEDLTTEGSQKDGGKEEFSKDHLDKLGDLLSETKEENLDDTGPFQPIRNGENG